MPEQIIAEEDMQQLAHLVSAMEPENLHCDGEVSHAEAMRRLAVLKRKWREIEQRTGRSITSDEVWAYVFKKQEERYAAMKAARGQ